MILGGCLDYAEIGAANDVRKKMNSHKRNCSAIILTKDKAAVIPRSQLELFHD